MGSPTYYRVEAIVLTDILGQGLDLDEIAAKIEEARFEAQYS